MGPLKADQNLALEGYFLSKWSLDAEPAVINRFTSVNKKELDHYTVISHKIRLNFTVIRSA